MSPTHIRVPLSQPLDEAAWAALFDENAIHSAQSVAEHEYDKLTTEEYYYLRRRCKTDLFFLTTLLGYDRLSTNLHGHLCRWIERTAWEQFRLTLLPRDHLKTTIITICDSIRAGLTTDSGTEAP